MPELPRINTPKVMYFIKRRLYRWFFKLLKKTPNDMPMVQYWKTQVSIPAKVTTNSDGAIIMQMEGEKYAFPGFPRGHLLFGSLSKLKHEIKNQLFNDTWARLEQGDDKAVIIRDIKHRVIDQIAQFVDMCRYDMVPPERMVKPVREIWRAWTKLEEKHTGEKRAKLRLLKEALTYVLQEDDAYRFRAQWLVEIFNPGAWWFKLFFRDPVKDFEIALTELEHAEIVGDMKLKIKLLRRILLFILEDPTICRLFKQLCKELDWKKLRLSEGDKYHFRGKWFKVDWDKFEY